MIDRQPYRNGNSFQVHPDESGADIKPCVCMNRFDKDRMRKAAISCGCKRAACFRLRYGIDDFKIMRFGVCRLNNKRTVEMLAALRRKKYTFSFQHIMNPGKNVFRDFRIGI